MKAELMRDGLKNTYGHEIDETVAKELGLGFRTIFNWKSKLGQTTPNHKYLHNKTAAKELGLSFTTIYAWKSDLGQTSKHKNSHSKQKELMKLYYEIKNTNPKISNENIAKMLKIGTNTLYTWKRGFKRQQMHPNSVDGHSVEENAAANTQLLDSNGQTQSYGQNFEKPFAIFPRRLRRWRTFFFLIDELRVCDRDIFCEFNKRLMRRRHAKDTKHFTIGKVNLANPNQNINTPTANKRN
uniref:Transposase n=1 Tax=Globodera rostochiensis TaxID=31243 RepID=A0A914HT74_GLORO